MTKANMQPTIPQNAPISSSMDAAHRPEVLRQTQALIGIVLLASVAASSFVSPVWGLVPAVIGLGLLFAGASGVCPMASLIARMPWNRAPDPQGPASSNHCCGGRCG